MDDSLFMFVLPPLLLVPAMGLLSMIRSSHRIGQELKRKAFHVSFGLVSLSFPLVWSESWMVVTGLAMAFGWMLAVRVLPCLQKYFGSVLHDCDRKSAGEFYYAISVAGLILATGGKPQLYIIPILILALADAAAAIFGRLISSRALTGIFQGKSVAGCAAFFIVAATVSVTTLIFYTQLPVTSILSVALLVSAASCLAEALCRNGLDNLVVPFTAWAVLAVLQF